MPHLVHSVIDARCQKRSTALVTNFEFDRRREYLSDPVVAMVFSDRIFGKAIVLKIAGRSYGAERALNQPS